MGTTFYTGSLGGVQGVYRGDLRTGEGSQFIPGNGGPFVGMKVDDRARLWIAGGGTGAGYVYDTTTTPTGALLRSFSFASGSTFVNDVIVTEDGAWFTESRAPRLYRVAIGSDGAIGSATTIDLTGKIEFVSGVNNLNGIAATPDGSTLIVVNSSTGKLYTIDTETTATEEIRPRRREDDHRRRHPASGPDAVRGSQQDESDRGDRAGARSGRRHRR